jgi:ubiquinone/menaquinone biosynthesis C-methylase UbiE
MDYNSVKHFNESQYLISMTPLEKVIEIGFLSGMNENSEVLDLCCGYGQMLKMWHKTFGIKGIGVDICGEFISDGNLFLKSENITDITLIEYDVLKWETDKQFDYACLCGEEFGGLKNTIKLLEKFVKPQGKLIIGTRFSKTNNPPQELIDFEGETLPLKKIYEIFSEHGYFITAMASDTDNEWERYIMWSARRHLSDLRKNPNNESQLAWCKKWYETYFDFRRQYEGYATFTVEKV